MVKEQRGFSFREHQKIGKDIHRLRQKIRALNERVSEVYGETSKLANLTDKMLKDMGLLQKELNSRLCRENPSSNKLELLACYYPDRA
jgi:predicted nuclease with TOPRIM domain